MEAARLVLADGEVVLEPATQEAKLQTDAAITAADSAERLQTRGLQGEAAGLEQAAAVALAARDLGEVGLTTAQR